MALWWDFFRITIPKIPVKSEKIFKNTRDLNDSVIFYRQTDGSSRTNIRFSLSRWSTKFLIVVKVEVSIYFRPWYCELIPISLIVLGTIGWIVWTHKSCPLIGWVGKCHSPGLKLLFIPGYGFTCGTTFPRTNFKGVKNPGTGIPEKINLI